MARPYPTRRSSVWCSHYTLHPVCQSKKLTRIPSQSVERGMRWGDVRLGVFPLAQGRGLRLPHRRAAQAPRPLREYPAGVERPRDGGQDGEHGDCAGEHRVSGLSVPLRSDGEEGLMGSLWRCTLVYQEGGTPHQPRWVHDGLRDAANNVSRIHPHRAHGVRARPPPGPRTRRLVHCRILERPAKGHDRTQVERLERHRRAVQGVGEKREGGRGRGAVSRGGDGGAVGRFDGLSDVQGARVGVPPAEWRRALMESRIFDVAVAPNLYGDIIS